MPIWLTCIPPRMYHGLLEGAGMISLSMGGKGVCSSGPTFVGVVRPDVVEAVSTLSRSSLERWVNVDCMVEEIFGCLLVWFAKCSNINNTTLILRVTGDGSIGSAFNLGTESCLRCRFSIFRVRSAVWEFFRARARLFFGRQVVMFLLHENMLYSSLSLRSIA
eukprot:scaffold8673_cov130-Skeletonema_dohrnii-CCMP3373.AAC.3